MFFGALLIFPVVVSLIKYRSKAKKAEKQDKIEKPVDVKNELCYSVR